MEFNINECVSFSLSERGAEILNDYNKKREKYVKEVYGCKEVITSHKSDYAAGEAIKGPLWWVMHVFGGDKISLGYEGFCECGMIEFKE